MPSNIDQMSDEEIELTLELLKRKRARSGEYQAEPVPAPVARDGASAAPTVTRLQGRKAKPAIEEKWFHTKKVCAHCKKEKNVGKDFGVIATRGVQYANSWCSQCRSETSASYRSKPRKNHSKHTPEIPKKSRK